MVEEVGMKGFRLTWVAILCVVPFAWGTSSVWADVGPGLLDPNIFVKLSKKVVPSVRTV